MSKPILHVYLAVGENCATESYALRASLEYLGIQVTMRWIGRPNDLIDILSGKESLELIDFLILNFHGDNGCFHLPKLAKEIYTKNEPQAKFLTPKYIRKIAKFKNIKIISSGCTLGKKALAKAMLDSGAELYIAPKGYIDGKANLIFLLNFFYELTKKESISKAFIVAQSIDRETKQYQLYLK